MTRILIVGGPRCGKTTLSSKLAKEQGHSHVWHTDDLLDIVYPRYDPRAWSAHSEDVMSWFLQPGPWIIEGVPVARSIRKWVKSFPGTKPCDIIHVMDKPYEELTFKRTALLKGTMTVWDQVERHMNRLGVEVHR